jgi:hypothetical protein
VPSSARHVHTGPLLKKDTGPQETNCICKYKSQWLSSSVPNDEDSEWFPKDWKSMQYGCLNVSKPIKQPTKGCQFWLTEYVVTALNGTVP